MRCTLKNLTGSLLFLILCGCAPRHAVILVPDPGGQVGKADVTTAGGSRLLERANDMTRVSGPSSAPSPVTTADPDYIATTFADALAVEPLPAEKFILFFDTGSITLDLQSQATITKIVEAVKRRGALSIAVSGHADAAGSAQLNDKLALERAELVKDLLLRNGVNPERVTVTSHGRGNPLVPTPEGVAEPKNRRVEVVVR